MTFSPAERERLRVCFFIPAFADGGAQRQCIFILNELSRRSDVELTLIRTSPGVHDGLLDRTNINIRDVKVRSNFDPAVIPRVRAILKQTRSQVLYSWLQASDVPSYFIRLVTPRLRWIISERNSYYRDEWRFRLRAALGRRADAVVSNSPAGDRYWAGLRARGKRYVIGNIVTAPPATNLPRPPGLDFDAEGFTIAVIGRLEKQKNPITMLDAFISLARRRPEVRLVFVGEGSLRPELQQRAEDSGLGDRIRFFGFRHDVQAILQHVDVLLTLSLYEGMPNVMVESIVVGLPVVASRIPEHTDVLGDEYPFFVDEYRDARQAADVLERILGDTNATGSVAGVKSALESRTAERVADEYMTAFRAVVGKGRS